jgi:hypothetical protein
MEREGQNKKKRRIWIPIATVGVIAAVIAGIFGYKALNKKDLGKYDAMYQEGAILEYALGLPNYAHYTLADEDEEEKYWEHVSEIRRNLMLYGEDKALGPVKRFSGKLAAEILSKREGKNSVFSPVNIYLALGMLAEAAGGETRAEILKLTESSGIEDMRERYKNLWDILYQDDELGKCLLGSSLWLRDDSKYKKDTVKRLADTYYSATFRGKMGSEPYNEALRKWINVHTGDMLNESVSDEKMEEEVVFALVTTIWFSGDWSEMFSKGATADGTFYAADGEKTVPFMHKVEDDGDYYAGEHFGAVCKYLINLGIASLPRLELPKPKNALPLDSSIAFLASCSSVIPCASLIMSSTCDFFGLFSEQPVVTKRATTIKKTAPNTLASVIFIIKPLRFGYLYIIKY